MQTTKTTNVTLLTVNNLSALTAGLKKGIIKKMMMEHPDFSIEGFFWIGNTLKYNGKVAAKKTIKKIFGKTDANMETFDYIKNVVVKNNPKFAEDWSDIKGDVTEWRPVVISNADAETISKFAEHYLIAADGTILKVNDQNCMDCEIKKPYFHKGSFYINLRNPDAKCSDDYMEYHRNQQVHSLVANTWGEDASLAIKEREEELAKAI